MDQNSALVLMAFFQFFGIAILLGEDGHKFFEKKSRLLFIFMPTLTILSLIWRPL